MAIRERLNEKVSKDIDEDLDDLDLAYIQQLRDMGVDESLIMQFVKMAKAEKEGNDE